MLKLTLLVSAIVFLIAIGPIITIWSLNTLFGVGIAYSLATWIAVVWLQFAIAATYIGKR